MASKVKLTNRQMDHLLHLADGEAHRPIKSATTRSCYLYLVRRGLAKIEMLQGRPRYRITAKGRRAHLASSGKTGE
jgi:hypothetical protein